MPHSPFETALRILPTSYSPTNALISKVDMQIKSGGYLLTRVSLVALGTAAGLSSSVYHTIALTKTPIIALKLVGRITVFSLPVIGSRLDQALPSLPKGFEYSAPFIHALKIVGYVFSAIFTPAAGWISPRLVVWVHEQLKLAEKKEEGVPYKGFSDLNSSLSAPSASGSSTESRSEAESSASSSRSDEESYEDAPSSSGSTKKLEGQAGTNDSTSSSYEDSSSDSESGRPPLRHLSAGRHSLDSEDEVSDDDVPENTDQLNNESDATQDETTQKTDTSARTEESSLLDEINKVREKLRQCRPKGSATCEGERMSQDQASESSTDKILKTIPGSESAPTAVRALAGAVLSHTQINGFSETISLQNSAVSNGEWGGSSLNFTNLDPIAPATPSPADKKTIASEAKKEKPAREAEVQELSDEDRQQQQADNEYVAQAIQASRLELGGGSFVDASEEDDGFWGSGAF